MRRMNYCLPVFLIAVAWTTGTLHAQVVYFGAPYGTAPYSPVRYAPAPYAAVPYAPVAYAPGPPVQAGGKIYVVSNTDIKSGTAAIGAVTAGNILTVEDVSPGFYQVNHKAYSVRGWIPQEAAISEQEAFNRFSARIQYRPTASGYVGRALILKSRGDLGGAMRDFDAALALEPQHVYALHGRGALWMKEKEWTRSIRDFDQVLRLTSDRDLNASAYRNRGVARLQLRDFELAIADFDASIQIDRSNSPDAFAHRGQARNFLNGNLDLALADLNEALRQNPKHVKAFSMRAANYQMRGDWDHALADYDQTLALNPQNPAALDNRGIVWEKMGNLDRAMSDFNVAMQVDPTFAPPFRHRARLYERQGAFDRAEADLNEFVRISVNEEHVTSLVTRAGFYARRNQISKAQDDIAEAQQIVNHQHPESLREIAWFLATSPKADLRQGKVAVDFAREASELTYFRRAPMLEALAAAYAESGDYDKAVETEKKAVALTGDSRQKKIIEGRAEHYAEHEPYHEEELE